jgi:hypothetical protein
MNSWLSFMMGMIVGAAMFAIGMTIPPRHDTAPPISAVWMI